MNPPDRQPLKLSDLLQAFPDNTQMPITPSPDIGQLPTNLTFPDIGQLPTNLTYPDVKELLKKSSPPDAAPAPIKPGRVDVTQLPTVHKYPDITQLPTPDITQLPTKPVPPRSSIPPVPLNNRSVMPPIAESTPQEGILLTSNNPKKSRLLLYVEIVLLFAASFFIPLLFYTVLKIFGVHITEILSYVVVISMVVSAYSISVQALFGLREHKLPVQLATFYPPASAIITAYLPDEATTIVETVKSVLSVRYPGHLQVIVAYNTPYPIEIENTLKSIAARDRRLVVLHVAHSTSKAENIQRALRDVTGTFVGIFDGDHHPEPNSFKRAWSWLAHDYHVVQGRRVVRNGDRSWIARLVAVESEIRYALEYSARARISHLNIFDGANGYWRSDVLRKVGMNSFMLAESVDASIRALQQGYKIMHDPLLIARELAPETLQAFWNQRTRRTRGVFQVALEHFWTNQFSAHLSLRQKAGSLHLLVGREISTWLPCQLLPILAFQVLQGDWLQFAPLFVLSTTFTFGLRLLQALLTQRVAIPEIRKHYGWFGAYTVLSLLFFDGLQRHIICIAQLQELSGKREANQSHTSR